MYASRNWGYHFDKSTKDGGIITRVQEFMNEKAIYWVELMSLLRISKDEGESINTLGQCLSILASIEKVCL